MTNDSANYYMLVNEWAWPKSQVCLLRLEVDMGSVLDRVRAWIEMVIWCVKDVYAKSSLK